jgi:hypothetical protein
MPSSMARLLMYAGAAIFLLGSAFYLAGRFNIPFGRLPGDFHYESGNFKFFFPLTSMLLVSVFLTVIINLIARFLNR